MKSINLSTYAVCDDNGGTPFACTTTALRNTAGTYRCCRLCVKGLDRSNKLSGERDFNFNSDRRAPNGWYIDLDAPAGTAYSERVITDPLAAQNGAVFFTSFSPNTDICAYGGYTNLWAVKYDTAAAVGAYISGIGLMQVSTGAIEQINLGSRFGEADDTSHRLGRRTDAIDGVPPTGQGLSLVVPPKPINKMLHIRTKMKSRGVTLVELIVVISIIGILAVALGFSYVGWQGKYKVEKATKEIYSALMTARSIAITRRINYLAAFPTATPTSYSVMADANDNGVADDTPLPTFPKTIEYTISWSGVNRILFDSSGFIRWDRNNDGIEETTDVIRLTPTADPDYDCVVISQTRIDMGKWNTTTVACDVK